MKRKRTALEYALWLDSMGLNVLPAARGGKSPLVPWMAYQDRRTTDKLEAWFRGSKDFNYWVATGRISRCIVLDIDSERAEEYWRSKIGDEMDATASVRTAKGTHYYFRLGDGEGYPSWGRHSGDGVSFDVRGDGAGVIAPPSMHETGVEYEWIRGPESMKGVPAALLSPERAETGSEGAPARSMLAELLSSVPSKGGRNNWLARVAGHYAKLHYPLEDAYRASVAAAAASLSPPLPTKEMEKTVASIWRSEVAQREERLETFGEDTGYLLQGTDAKGGAAILIQTRRKVGEEHVLEVEPWLNADIRALGVVEDEEAKRSYEVEVIRGRDGKRFRRLLPAATIARHDRREAWLAELGIGVLSPDGVWPKMGGAAGYGERLRRYLDAQDPKMWEVVPALGWNGDGFLTHEGVIRRDGFHEFDRRRPDPALRQSVTFSYGFRPEQEAIAVLREVLTFHDETLSAVFGAWWAACLLKPQVSVFSSQFPIMALQAPSESGKSSGMLPMMLELAGFSGVQANPTQAAFRDSLVGHYSGIAWVDDKDDTGPLLEVLRQATVGGAMVKKGEDRTQQVVVTLRAPVLITGESLQMENQKALLDRTIRVPVPSPTQRRSHKDPSKLQWADVLELRRAYPKLSEFAGTIVQMALQRVDLVAELPSLVPVAGGRFGDKIAVVRVGARVLADMVGDPTIVERVDVWAQAQDDLGSENTLTLELLPQVLSQLGFPDRVEEPDGRWPATPVIVKDRIVWFNARALARWWSELHHGRIEKRVHSQEAIEEQSAALGELRSRKMRVGRTRSDYKLRYQGLSEAASAIVVARARGESGRVRGGRTLPLSKGLHPELERQERQYQLWLQEEEKGRV